jgi:hypothetical protein
MRGKRSMFGNILQPDECWMLDGRLPTVTLRMNRSSKNAERIATQLAGNPKVARVLYPTLFTDPEQIRIAHEQCDFPGGMFSLDLKGGKKAAFEFLRNLRIARNAVSLGLHRRGIRRSGRHGRPGADFHRHRRLARSAGGLPTGFGTYLIWNFSTALPRWISSPGRSLVPRVSRCTS